MYSGFLLGFPYTVHNLFMTYTIILIPLVSALLGWLFTYLGIQAILSLLIRSQASIARSAGQAAAKQAEGLFNIEERVSDPALLDAALPAIEQHIDEFLQVKLKEEMPMISMFIGNKTTDKLKGVFIDQLKKLFPSIMQQLAGKLRAGLDIETLVYNKIAGIPPASLKQGIQEKTGGMMARVQLIGALAGLCIGLVNLVIFWLTAGTF